MTGTIVPGVASSSLHYSSWISTFRSTIGASFGILKYHAVSAVLQHGKSPTSGGLGFECIQTSLDISGKVCLSSFCIISFGSVHVSDRTCQRSVQTFDSSNAMLDGGSLASHILNMLEDVSQHCPVIKDLTVDVLVGQALKGLPYLF